MLDAKAFPAYVANVGPVSQRAQMSVKLLSEGPKFSFEEFVAKKHEMRSLMADRMIPELVQAAQGNSDPDIRTAIDLLKAWDHRDTADARGALLFETWASIFSPNNFTDQKNYAVKWTIDDPLQTPRGLKDPAAAVAMLKQAVAKTKQLYGAVDRPYGEVSRFRVGDTSVPGNGGFGNTGIFRTITWEPMKNGERKPRAGETWVAMIEFGTPLKAMGLMSYGSSSQPGSRHMGDQLPYLSQGKLRTLWIDRKDVEAHVEDRTAY